MADLLKVRYGAEAQLPATRDEFTLYFTTDTKKIFKGNDEYTSEIYNIAVGNETQTQGQKTITLTFKDGSTAEINILNAKAQEAILGILGSTATGSVKGLVTLSDATNDKTNDTSKGVAATPKAVAAALEAANNYTDQQIAAGFSANDAMVMKGTIAADGKITSGDTTINGKLISAITGYSSGWTFRVAAASTNPLWSGSADTKVEAGDMVVAIKDYVTANQAADWSIVQSNLIGAVTSDSTLTESQVVLGAGGQKVKILAAGLANQVLTIVNGTPTWKDLPVDENTTYTFKGGTDGSFSVTPSGGSAQTVYIGKPSTAGTADKVKNKLSVSINTSNTSNMISTTAKTFDGSAAVSIGFGEAAAKNVSTTVENKANLVTAAAVYDALLWKSFSE